MSEALPIIYLARHGETAWSLSGQHTGRTDIPLTERGERQARALGERLRRSTFTKVLVSPSQRAGRTAALAGFGNAAVVDPDLAEWDYGRYEGRRTAEILAERPGWLLFRDGCPEGEMAAQVGARADHVIERVRAAHGNVLLFSSSHILRVIAARWLGLEPAAGRCFCSEPRASASSTTSTITPPSRQSACGTKSTRSSEAEIALRRELLSCYRC